MHFKEGDTYYAQAIIHSNYYNFVDNRGQPVKHRAWTPVAFASSKDGVLGALELLWNRLQSTVPPHMKRKYSPD